VNAVFRVIHPAASQGLFIARSRINKEAFAGRPLAQCCDCHSLIRLSCSARSSPRSRTHREYKNTQLEDGRCCRSTFVVIEQTYGQPVQRTPEVSQTNSQQFAQTTGPEDHKARCFFCAELIRFVLILLKFACNDGLLISELWCRTGKVIARGLQRCLVVPSR
jgi:hypothetical protein